jgi:hypothetical protein
LPGDVGTVETELEQAACPPAPRTVSKGALLMSIRGFEK